MVPNACSFKHAQRTFPPNFQTRPTHACHPTLPLGDTPNKRVPPQTLALSVGRRRFCRGTRRRRTCWADRHLSAVETSPSQPWPAPNCPHPHAPKFSSSTASSSLRAIWTFEALCWYGRPSGSGGRHVKGEHIKITFKRRNPGAKKGMLRRAATRTRARP